NKVQQSQRPRGCVTSLVEQGQPAMAPDMERPATAWKQTDLLRPNQVAACYGLQWERPATALVLLDRERPATAFDDAEQGTACYGLGKTGNQGTDSGSCCY